jgi:hypothetical protein
LQRNVATAGYALTLQKSGAIGLLRSFLFLLRECQKREPSVMIM